MKDRIRESKQPRLAAIRYMADTASGFYLKRLPTTMAHVVLLLTALAAAGLVSDSALACSAPPAATRQSTGQGSDTSWTAQGLSATVVQEESIGLSMHFPLGATISKQPRSIFITSDDHKWVGQLEIVTSKDQTITLDHAVDEAIDKIKSNSAKCSVRSRRNITISGHEAREFILDIEFSNPQGRIRETRLYGFFEPLPHTFAVYSVRGDGTDDKGFLQTGEATIRSISLRDPAEVQKEIDQQIKSTQAVLDGLNEAKYRAMLIPESWYRVYRKTDAGDRELAYYRMQESVGARAEVGSTSPDASTKPDEPGKGLTATEREIGVVVHQTARAVVYDEKNVAGLEGVVEVRGVYWMSFDRKRGVFAIQQTSYAGQKDGGFKLAGHATITGVLNDGKVKVVSIGADGAPDSRTFDAPPCYITQAEQHLLYRMLNPGQSGSYVMYIYSPIAKTMKRRSEMISATSQPDRFEVISTPDPDQSKLTKTIDAKGRILRMVSVTGEITEASTPAEIQKDWKAKGLPTGSLAN